MNPLKGLLNPWQMDKGYRYTYVQINQDWVTYRIAREPKKYKLFDSAFETVTAVLITLFAVLVGVVLSGAV